ncbi:MAG: hypothetical protein J6K72_10185 [Clostridia bacterium]|nr:hypothetical protein [Clostridia bacterium]
MSELFKLYQHLYAQFIEQKNKVYMRRQKMQQVAMDVESQKQAIIQKYSNNNAMLKESYQRYSAYKKAAEMYYRPTVQHQGTAVFISEERMSLLYEQFHGCSSELKSDYAKRLYDAAVSGMTYVAAQRNALSAKQDQELSYLSDSVTKTSNDDIIEACDRIIDSAEMCRFSYILQNISGKYDAQKKNNQASFFDSERLEELYIGYCQFPLPAPRNCRNRLATKLREHYDVATQTVLIPSSLPDILFIQCSGIRVDEVFSAIKKILHNIICFTKPLSGRVFFIDSRAMDGTCIRPFDQFSNVDGFIAEIPQNHNELCERLRHLRSLVRDNQQRFLIYRDFGSSSNEDLQWLCNNGSNYGLKVIIVQDYIPDKNFSSTLPPYLPSNNVLRLLDSEGQFMLCNEKQKFPFALCDFQVNLSSDFAQKVFELYKPVQQDMRLFSVFPLPAPGKYTRNRQKDIYVPLGIGSKTKKTYFFHLDFELDFAAFLLGASGSGKTTLIHTLISGILMNYHPDDVELWLADYSVAIFSQYITNCAPHIKYVLMDDSPEQVYSFFDRVDEEAKRRATLFNNVAIKTGTAINKLEHLPPEYYLPKILIIIDEFLLFSTIAAGPNSHDAASYRKRFTNMLIVYRKYGFRFLFSGQSFDSGLSVVEDAAQKNISTRIALPADKKDITALMDVSATSMKAEWAWDIEHLAAHHALISERRNKAQISEPIALFYLNDADMVEQGKYIRAISQAMHSVEDYTPNDPLAYVDKHPILINATQPVFFHTHEQEMKADYRAWCSNPAHRQGDLLLYPGEPKNLTHVRHVLLAPERKQQMVLYGQYAINLLEIASIVYSSIRSARVQKVPVEIWTAASDLLENRFGKLWDDKVAIYHHISQIEQRIDLFIEQMKNHIVSPKLVVIASLEEMLQEYEDELEEEAFFGTFNDSNSEPNQTIDMATVLALVQQNQNNGISSYDPPNHTIHQPQKKTPQEMVEEFSKKLRFLFEHSSRYGIFLFYIVDRPSRLKSVGVREECFGHSFVFPSTWTIDECSLPIRMALRQLSSPKMYVHQSSSGISNYATFSLSEKMIGG